MADKSEILAKQLAAIRENFANKLDGHVERFYNHWKTLQTDWQPNLLHEWYREAHTIAGSAPTFGFVQIGDIARQLEYLLKPFTQSVQAPDAEQSQQINTLLSEIKQAVNQTTDNNLSESEFSEF